MPTEVQMPAQMPEERARYVAKARAWLALRGVPTLSLTQPWASLVAVGAKRIETRNWRTAYSGPLLIHASKTWKVYDRELLEEWPFDVALRAHDITRPSDVPLGALLGLAWLTGCHPADRAPAHDPLGWEAAFGFYGPGRIGWQLAAPERFATPTPARGALGLWHCYDPVMIDRAVAYVARRWDTQHTQQNKENDPT